MLYDLSRITHRLIRGHNVSWCAYAYEHRSHWFWACWVRLFGRQHCHRSWRHYGGTSRTP